MKTTKIIAAVMAMTMTMGLCACGDSADSGTTDSKSTKSTVAQDKSQAETTASNDEETSSAVEEVDYQYGVVSIDVHFRFSKHFDLDWKVYSTIDPMSSMEDDSCFLTVGKLCDEYNNLTIDADKPEEWLDIVHDQMAKDLSNGYTYTMVQIHSEADVDSVFMGMFEKKTVNGEESYSLNFDGNGSSTDRLVYNGFIGY